MRSTRSTSAALTQPSRCGHVGGEQHAGADGLAVQPGRVVSRALDGVTEGVAEIEQRALALLALVARRRSPP